MRRDAEGCRRGAVGCGGMKRVAEGCGGVRRDAEGCEGMRMDAEGCGGVQWRRWVGREVMGAASRPTTPRTCETLWPCGPCPS